MFWRALLTAVMVLEASACTSDGAHGVSPSVMTTPEGSTGHVTAAAPDSSTDILQPGKTLQDCKLCPTMVMLPAGTFQMGPRPGEFAQRSEHPTHKATIGYTFAVGKYEVTIAEWNACRAASACPPIPDSSGHDEPGMPVAEVSWNDIQDYLAWLSHVTGRHYRLLSEAEWEYAARAGTNTAYSYGSQPDPNRMNVGPVTHRALPVGTFPANGFGLYDMHGNLSEWVADCWNESYAGAPIDGSAWTSGDCERHGVRGGDWHIYVGALRSASRDWNWANVQNPYTGFRVAVTLTEPGV
jgi:formylglycine-generating enzyme required for sulfatase activity